MKSVNRKVVGHYRAVHFHVDMGCMTIDDGLQTMSFLDLVWVVQREHHENII